MRTDWEYETCKLCTREQRLAWSVNDELWKTVVIDYYQTKVLCLECFLRMADDRGVVVMKDRIVFHEIISRESLKQLEPLEE